MAIKTKSPPRQRIGRVSVYDHHDRASFYYRDEGQVVRQQVGTSRPLAETVASIVNAKLIAATAVFDLPTLLA